jgi:hypothetical protein
VPEAGLSGACVEGAGVPEACVPEVVLSETWLLAVAGVVLLAVVVEDIPGSFGRGRLDEGRISSISFIVK